MHACARVSDDRGMRSIRAPEPANRKVASLYCKDTHSVSLPGGFRASVDRLDTWLLLYQAQKRPEENLGPFHKILV